MTIRIVVGDERRLISEAIAETLKTVPDFDVVAIVNVGEQIVPTVLRARPDVALLGSTTTGRDSLTLADELRAAAPHCGVAVLAPEPAHAVMHRASADIFSVVPNSAGLEHLCHAIRGVAGSLPSNRRRPARRWARGSS